MLVGKNGGVGNRFDESSAKNRSRDSENNVRISAFPGEWISYGPEVKLRDLAAGGVAPAGNDEEGMNVAVGCAVAFLEARLTDRAIGRDTVSRVEKTETSDE